MRALKMILPLIPLIFVHAQIAIASEAFVAQPRLSTGAMQNRFADKLLSVPIANAFALAARESPQTNAPAGANSAEVIQIGANNVANVLQSGVGNAAMIFQHGQNNAATVVQSARAR